MKITQQVESEQRISTFRLTFENLKFLYNGKKINYKNKNILLKQKSLT